MKNYAKYFGGLALLALCSCSDDNAPQAPAGEVVKSFSIGVDSDLLSRANAVPGDGSDILELSYVIRDDKNEIVFATGKADSPEPVKNGNKWSLEVTLPARQSYKALFWADKAGVTGVVSDWRTVAAQKGSAPVTTIVANADSLYVRRNNGWAGIADDAMAKYFVFDTKSNTTSHDITLTRPHCQVLIGAYSDNVLEKVMNSSFGFLDNKDNLLVNGTILFDSKSGIGGSAPLNSCVPTKMANQMDYDKYLFPDLKPVYDNIYLIGGGYFSPASLNTTGLDANTLVIKYAPTSGAAAETVEVALDKFNTPMDANSRILVILYPHNEAAPSIPATTSRAISNGSNNIVIPVAI